MNEQRYVKMRVYDSKGHVVPGLRKKAAEFFRCKRTGKMHGMHWRVIKNLYQIYRAFDEKTIEVVSGFRHPSVNKSKKSRHTMGKAVDFRVRGVDVTALRDYLIDKYQDVGIGYYPDRFVHLDVARKHKAIWIDTSGPGEDPKYVDNARERISKERQRKKNKTNARKKKTVKKPKSDLGPNDSVPATQIAIGPI